MKLLDILSAPWAIQPDKLLEIQAIYATHLRGEKIDIAGVEARLGKPLANEQKPYQIQNGVAIIPMEGVLAKRMNLFSQISGGASMQVLAQDIQSAMDDPLVSSIVLLIDSPGGTVDGTQTLSALVREAAARKPVVAFADGLMASAAYWIGSAADAIVISSSTAMVGSIGVVATHRDVSAAEAMDGVKTTEIAAGKYKRIASQYAPLSEEGQATIQAQVDQLYTIFVDAVATHRGVTTDYVLQEMADGRVFLGQDALDRGLVDGIDSLQNLITRMSLGDVPKRVTAGAVVVAQAIAAGAAEANQPPNIGENPMSLTLEQIRAAHPEIAKALTDEGFTAGAESERNRIRDVESQCMPGHESLIAEMKFDGKTTGPEAAVRILQAEKTVTANRAAALAKEAPVALPHGATEAALDTATAEDQAAPLEERAKAKWDANEKLRAEFGGKFAAYLGYEKAQAAGKVRSTGDKK